MGVLSAASPLSARLVPEALAADPDPRAANPAPSDAPSPPDHFDYFTAPEVALVEAALARLIPSDELGPGAKEAGVAVFIDRQLAGPFGTMARNYRLGPWQEGTPQQGYQSKLTPREVYRVALAEIDRHCEERYGKSFAQLEASTQDEILHGLDEGRLALPSVGGAFFFNLFWANVQEGFFADPIHGGNRDKVGWRLVGFPGVAAVYTEAITKHGVPYRAEPVSIADVQGNRVRVDEHGHPVHRLQGEPD
jgi:gluconate 2-dehydrogenase gamma chain